MIWNLRKYKNIENIRSTEFPNVITTKCEVTSNADIQFINVKYNSEADVDFKELKGMDKFTTIVKNVYNIKNNSYSVKKNFATCANSRFKTIEYGNFENAVNKLFKTNN